MTRSTETPNQNVDLGAIGRRKKGNGASEALKPGADDLRRRFVRYRRQRLADRVDDTPVSVSCDGREKERLCRLGKTRQKNLTAYLSYDLSRNPRYPSYAGKFIAAVKVDGVSFHRIDTGAANANASFWPKNQSSVDDCHQASVQAASGTM
jgi:hypothetical protein